MSNRKRLPNRRGSEIYDFETLARPGVNPMAYTATVGFFDDGTMAEIFLRSGRAGSDLSIQSMETAIAVSMAFQHGCSAETLRAAMPRDDRQRPEGPVGMLLDILARIEAEMKQVTCKTCTEPLKPSIEHEGRLWCKKCAVYPAMIEAPVVAAE